MLLSEQSFYWLWVDFLSTLCCLKWWVEFRLLDFIRKGEKISQTYWAKKIIIYWPPAALISKYPHRPEREKNKNKTNIGQPLLNPYLHTYQALTMISTLKWLCLLISDFCIRSCHSFHLCWMTRVSRVRSVNFLCCCGWKRNSGAALD